MSHVECDLVKLLLKKYFGSIVAKVGEYLCLHKWQPLLFIAKGTDLKLNLVKKSLCVLLQRQLVIHRTHKRKIEYNFLLENGLNLNLIPKIICTAKLLYGAAGEYIIEELCVHGTSIDDVIIKRVLERVQDTSDSPVSLSDVEEVFQNLVKTRFLIKEEIKEEDDASSDTRGERSKDDSVGQPSGKRKLSDDEGPQSKRQRQEQNDQYSINFSRFLQYFRDQLIIDGITHKFGASSGEIIRTMLRISEVTTPPDAKVTHPITSNEISHALPANHILPLSYIEQYLSIMMNDEDNCVQKSDESSICIYVINFRKCILALCRANILSYIHERFGSKSCRIFKLLLLKNHMEQKQVEDFAMIPSKEAKELLYLMLSENLLVMQEIAKTTDHAPSRTFYLFNVNLPKIVRTLTSRACRTLINLLTRQEFETQQNKRLLEKQERMESIKANLLEGDADQLEEIEAMLTPNDRSNLSKLEHCCKKLGKSRIQISDVLVLLKQFHKYNT